MKTFLTLCLIAATAIAANSQDRISGTIPNWSRGAGQVAVMSMGPPEVIGTLAADGSFEVPLKPDYLAEVEKAMEAANSRDNNGWTASLNTLEGRYSCLDDTLEKVNAGQPITGFPAMGAFMLVNMEEEKNLGYLMMGSSKAFAESMRPNKFQPGYFLEWYFLGEDARVSGECSISSYAMNQEETYEHLTVYDLDFKAGWNIVKYEILEVFTDKEGNSYPKKERYSILSEMPAEVELIYLTD